MLYLNNNVVSLFISLSLSKGFVSDRCLWQTPSLDRIAKQFSLVPRTFLSLMQSFNNGIISKVLLSTVVLPHAAI